MGWSRKSHRDSLNPQRAPIRASREEDRPRREGNRAAPITPLAEDSGGGGPPRDTESKASCECQSKRGIHVRNLFFDTKSFGTCVLNRLDLKRDFLNKICMGSTKNCSNHVAIKSQKIVIFFKNKVDGYGDFL